MYHNTGMVSGQINNALWPSSKLGNLIKPRLHGLKHSTDIGPWIAHMTASSLHG